MTTVFAIMDGRKWVRNGTFIYGELVNCGREAENGSLGTLQRCLQVAVMEKMSKNQWVGRLAIVMLCKRDGRMPLAIGHRRSE